MNPPARIVSELERAGIPRMLVGSFASAYHGDPRTAHDIDLVLDPDRASLDLLVRQLDPRHFYIRPEAVDEAWLCRAQRNAMILDVGWRTGPWSSASKASGEMSCAAKRQASDGDPGAIRGDSPLDESRPART